MTGTHSAKRWVEEHFPTITGNEKARLILAYGAGLDAGMAEAQEILEHALREQDAQEGLGPGRLPRRPALEETATGGYQ